MKTNRKSTPGRPASVPGGSRGDSGGSCCFFGAVACLPEVGRGSRGCPTPSFDPVLV